MSEYQFVTIKRKPQDRIPNEIFAEAPMYVGGGFSRDTNDVLRGITFEEEEYLLPSIIGVSADSHKFVEAAKLFHAEIDIPVPYETGKRLNITTRKRTILDKDKEKKEVDYPVVPLDYIYYKHCLKNSEVAKNLVEANANTSFKYYIEDVVEEQKVTSATRDIKLLAKQNLVNLIAGKEKDFSLIKAILVVAKDVPGWVKSVSEDEEVCMNTLEELSEKHPVKFNEFCADKMIKAKAFVHQLIAFNIIQTAGNAIYDDSLGVDVVANDMDTFIKLLQQPEKSQYKGQLQHRLQSKRGK